MNADHTPRVIRSTGEAPMVGVSRSLTAAERGDMDHNRENKGKKDANESEISRFIHKIFPFLWSSKIV